MFGFIICNILYFKSSTNEKKILKSPQEIDLGSYSSESPMQMAYAGKV